MTSTYIYTYTYRKEEQSLCALEMRSLFGVDSESGNMESNVQISPSRSPFIRERIDVIYEGDYLEDITSQVEALQLKGSTFKVIFVKNSDLPKFGFEKRREIEREIGLHILGEANLLKPDVLFGIMNVNGRWVFGKYFRNGAVWLRHQKKPHSYSTALSTRVARAIVNIAVPNPRELKVIDPCCGIGTVLVEARSMGINIVGSDRNHLIIPGVLENLEHFGLVGEVTCRDIRNVTENYDVAIIDMPYNLCSVLTTDEQLEMLQSARRFARKMVVVTIEDIDPIIVKAGFSITDRAFANKGRFSRQVIVCE